MKKILNLLIILIIMLAAAGVVDAENDAVLHYSFDSADMYVNDNGQYILKDLSNNGFDAWCDTEPELGADFRTGLYDDKVTAVRNECIHIDNEPLNIPVEALSTDDFTMNFWYAADATGDAIRLSGSSGYIFINGISGSGIVNIMDYYDTDGRVFQLSSKNCTVSNVLEGLHMYTIIRENGIIRIYVDGREQTNYSGALPQSNVKPSDLLAGDDAVFQIKEGTFDEFTLYHRALSKEEINNIKNSIVAPDNEMYPYKISMIILKSESGDTITELAPDKRFSAKVIVLENIDYDKYSRVFAAVYDTEGRLLSVKRSEPRIFEPGTVTLDFDMSGTKVGYIKALMLDEADFMTPLSECKELNFTGQ